MPAGSALILTNIFEWKRNWMEMKWRVPEVCHVNGPSWFSGRTSLTRLRQLFNTSMYCTIPIWLLYNMTLHTIQHVFAFCEMRLCVLYKCLALFAPVSHAGQWPICQQERAIDRIFAPRSLSKWGLQKTSPTLVICQNASLFPHFLFSCPLWLSDKHTHFQFRIWRHKAIIDSS